MGYRDIENFFKEKPLLLTFLGFFISYFGTGILNSDIFYEILGTKIPFWIAILVWVIFSFFVWFRYSKHRVANTRNPIELESNKNVEFLKRVTAIEGYIKDVKTSDYIQGTMTNIYPTSVSARYNDYNNLRSDLIKLNPEKFSGLEICEMPEANKYRTGYITEKDIKPLLGTLKYIRELLN